MTSCGERIWKGLAAGALGGLVGAYAMNQFQSLWSSASKAVSDESQKREPKDDSEDATVKVARAISERLFGHELTDSEKKWAGPVVHYSFGTAVGVLYGALTQTVPASRAGRGAAFGAGVWLAADEIGVPAAGLSKPTSKVPASSHISALAAHLVTALLLIWLCGLQGRATGTRNRIVEGGSARSFRRQCRRFRPLKRRDISLRPRILRAPRF